MCEYTVFTAYHRRHQPSSIRLKVFRPLSWNTFRMLGNRGDQALFVYDGCQLSLFRHNQIKLDKNIEGQQFTFILQIKDQIGK